MASQSHIGPSIPAKRKIFFATKNVQRLRGPAGIQFTEYRRFFPYEVPTRMSLTTHLHVMPRWRMYGDIPPHPHNTSCYTKHYFYIEYVYVSGASLFITAELTEYFPVALRPDSRSLPPLKGLRDHTHWTRPSRYDSSGRGISPTQRPLPDNTQQSQETGINAPSGFQIDNPSKRAAANPRLDRAATGISLTEYT
jgi:hypothetical protein